MLMDAEDTKWSRCIRIATVHGSGRIPEVTSHDGKLTQFADGSDTVIGACIEVHRQLGPGHLESTYESCLCHELALRGIPFRRQVPVPLSYKGLSLDCAYRMDLVVDAQILVELKVVERLLPVYRVTGSHLPGADRIEDRPAGQLQRAGPQARPATVHEQTSHLHGPSIGGESSGAQEGGELGRPEVGRHSACGGMDRVSPPPDRRPGHGDHVKTNTLTSARLPDPDLATKIRIP